MEENKEQIKKSNTGLIIILVLIIVGLASYIVCSKILSNKETKPISNNTNSEITNNETENDSNENSTENDNTQSTTNTNSNSAENNGTSFNKEYFDEYLYVFMPRHSASNFMKNIDSFSNRDITQYLYWYYVNQGLQKKNKSDQEKNNEEYTGQMYYTVAKSDLDALVYKMFGIKDYEIIETTSDTGIVKIDDNTYQVRSKATGWYAPSNEITNLEVGEKNATVECNLLGSAYDNTQGQIVGHLKFYLTKNDGNWNLTKIEYSK